MAQSTRPHRRLQAAWLACAFLIIAYAIYSSATRTGLAGYAMKVQMDLQGTSSESTTMLLTMGSLAIAFVILSAIAERFYPPLRAARVEAARWKCTPGSLTWTWVAIICAAPALIGGILTAALYESERQDAQAQVYSIDLRTQPAAAPKDARLVQVTGAIARPYVLVYKKTEDQKVTHELFAPLTSGAGHDPIRFIVHTEAPEAYDGKVAWPDDFRHKEAVPFSGRVSRALPAFVASGLRAKGAKLDPSCILIDWKDLRYRQAGVAGDDMMWLVPGGVGGLVSVMLIPVMAIVKVMLGRANRRQAAGMHA